MESASGRFHPMNISFRANYTCLEAGQVNASIYHHAQKLSNFNATKHLHSKGAFKAFDEIIGDWKWTFGEPFVWLLTLNQTNGSPKKTDKIVSMLHYFMALRQ